ncbi:MAG: cysteine--tRNA ligase [Bacteroidales bacterium]|nr:cysteine--tRNA ligase [Bacteroidales bacterium]
MLHQFYLYNTLGRKKELFEPVNPPYVGLYVCGPTVYSEPHLGHVRMAITFDILYRYLLFMGYKVRYVRNITDVGHLEDEASGEGEDKIAKKARLEQLEPMEIVQKYKNAFQQALATLNTLPPSIEPTASGHIIEQQIMVKKILDNGYAYEINGSVYFDINRYNRDHTYGILSGRKTEELLANTRTLEGQEEKHSPLDFALWKKAGPTHLMHWPSEWSEGFPGWHLECSVMGTKYLGETFDIHGGGMDLMFPHHECEIAQSVAANGKAHVKYWMHNNMITINGQKMARSLNNFITLNQLFTGTHPKLTKAYSPMTIRFFVLQAHYRSTLDFSDDALQAAEKGFARLMRGIQTLENLKPAGKSSVDIGTIEQNCFNALNDDLNYSLALSCLFDGITLINSVSDGKESLNEEDINKMNKLYHALVFDIFGLKIENREGETSNEFTSGLMELILNYRNEAKLRKDFATSDKIREQLANMGVSIRDTKDGTEWELM